MNGADYGRQKAAYYTFPAPSNYDTMSVRMEQTLSEVISLESTAQQPTGLAAGTNIPETSSVVGVATLGGGNSRVLSHASSVTGSNNQMQFTEAKYSFSFEMQIWMLIIELFLRLDMVCIYCYFAFIQICASNVIAYFRTRKPSRA